MKILFKCGAVAIALGMMLIADMPALLESDIQIPLRKHVQALFEQMVPEAHAVLGVRRRTRRRTAVVVGSAAAAQTAAAQQQTAAAQQEAAAAEQQAAAAQKQAAAVPAPTPAAAPAKTLPMGAVVTSLPPGASAQAIGGVQYFYDGSNYYRTAFQGNNLVYVTAKP